MQKLIIFILLNLVWTTSSFALSKATEDKFFNACMDGASNSGKNKKLQTKYCTCIVDYIDERYSDDQFLKFQNGSKEKYDKFTNEMTTTCLNKEELVDLSKNINNDKSVKNLNLECKGAGSIVSSMTKYDQNTGTTSQTNYKDRINSTINVYINNNESWIQIPTSLLPPIRNKKPNNKYDIYNLNILEDSITGKFKLNIANKPKITLDRYTGLLSYKGLGTSFTGKCKKVDRTKKKF